MADTLSKIIRTEPEHTTEQKGQKHFPSWHRLALGGIILISVFMDFFLLGQNGFSTYYPPAVRSMMDNWHNFFFASYDPGGFVTIDKPPLGFWLQVFSAKLLGFSTFSVLVPQALAGVLLVLLLYYLVRRHFGVVAGLLAALALALSPISVVTNRNITIDSTLALTLLLGAWAVIRAAETGRLRWLLLAAAIVGLGFNIKMMEAYLVVPAFGVLYLLAAPKSLWKRIGHLALALLVLLVISASWIVAVDLTPASQRPYVDSTQDNSEISLAIGYNGIDRLLRGFGGGFRGGFGGRPRGNNTTNTRNGSANGGGNGGPSFGNPPTTGTPSPRGNGGSVNTGRNGAGQAPPTGGFGGPFDTGASSALRLFNEPLAGQIAWLLPLALLGILALAWQRRPRFQSDRQQQSMIFWGMWLLTMGTFFSIAGFFHQYYMTEMAPAIAALFGIGLVTMWQDYRRGGWRGWLLPLALIATAAEQIHILNSYPTWSQWLTPLIVVLCVVAVGWLVSALIAPRIRVKAPSVRTLLPALGVGVLALMITPTVWAAIPILQHTESDAPLAGPAQRDGFGGFGGPRNGRASVDPALIRYLEANQGNTTFLVAVPSSMNADGLILATNKPVMAMGGFSGGDPILTTNQLASLVAKGTVRFFLIGTRQALTPQMVDQLLAQLPPQMLEQIPPQVLQRLKQGGGFGGFGFGDGRQSALTTWVTQHCTIVPTRLWQSSSNSTQNTFNPFGANQLYDCATQH
jgi:4-amino-4-deoxy-L-arabinose transferase-like glycosyltransferase